MGIMTTVAINCDQCFLWADLGFKTVPKTRQAAKREGWARTRKVHAHGENCVQDICPDCIAPVKPTGADSYWWKERLG